MKMDVSSAEKLLGCYLGGNPPATLAEVNICYKAALRLAHPDTGDGSVLPAVLQEARSVLVATLNRGNVSDFACKQCKGKGNVLARMGVKPCGVCKGTGETSGC